MNTGSESSENSVGDIIRRQRELADLSMRQGRGDATWRGLRRHDCPDDSAGRGDPLAVHGQCPSEGRPAWADHAGCKVVHRQRAVASPDDLESWPFRVSGSLPRSYTPDRFVRWALSLIAVGQSTPGTLRGVNLGATQTFTKVAQVLPGQSDLLSSFNASQL